MVAAMATFQVTAPESFDIRYPENWPKWIRRFERFRQASGLAIKSKENQVTHSCTQWETKQTTF